MIVSIHQPNFLPWLGYFNKALRSDALVLLDDVQYSKNSLTNRVLIKYQKGMDWLTVPVRHGSSSSIADTEVLAGPIWRRKLIATLRQNYARAPYLKVYLPELESIIVDESYCTVAGLNHSLIRWCMGVLGVRTRLILSSDLSLSLGNQLSGTEKIIYLLQASGATVYLSGQGAGARRYISEEALKMAGIELRWQYFKHPVYPQQHGHFEQFGSIIDLLLNVGPESRAYLEQAYENNT